MYVCMYEHTYECMYICMCACTCPKSTPMSLYTYLTYQGKNDCHIANVSHNHYVKWAYRLKISTYICQKAIHGNIYLTCNCHVCSNKRYIPQCHTYANVKITQCAPMGGFVPIYMPHMKSLASTMWLGVPYTRYRSMLPVLSWPNITWVVNVLHEVLALTRLQSIVSSKEVVV